MFKLFWVGNDEENYEINELDVDLMEWDEIKEEIWQVALDVLETDDAIHIVAPIAWVVYEDIDLSINKTVLTIKWTRYKPEEYDLDWVKIRNEECYWGNFSRNVILPENLDFDKINAYMQNNLLIVSVPKLKLNIKPIRINRIES